MAATLITVATTGAGRALVAVASVIDGDTIDHGQPIRLHGMDPAGVLAVVPTGRANLALRAGRCAGAGGPHWPITGALHRAGH